jgi:hypothetical protein
MSQLCWSFVVERLLYSKTTTMWTEVAKEWCSYIHGRAMHGDTWLVNTDNSLNDEVPWMG